MSRKINFYGKEPYIQKMPEGRFPLEHNDCVVRAASLASDRSYAEIHTEFTLLGRVACKGTVDSVIYSWLKDNSFSQVGNFNVKLTLGKWMRDYYPTGRYFVLILGHAVAVVDGVVLDWGSPTWGSPIRSIWKAR